MEIACIFYGLFVYFTVIWYILRPFGNVVVIWCIFPRFGKLCQEKSGNPGYNASEVKYYSTTSGPGRFENKTNLKKKRSSLPQRWRCSCKFRSRRIEPGIRSYDRELRSQRSEILQDS
jgi:hypothetical protein